MFKTRKRRIKEECWNLDYELIKWLNEHLATYLKDSEGTIDLTYYKYIYKKKEYNLKELCEIILEDTAYLLNSEAYWVNTESPYNDYKEIEYKKDEMYDLLKMIHWHLWW